MDSDLVNAADLLSEKRAMALMFEIASARRAGKGLSGPQSVFYEYRVVNGQARIFEKGQKMSLKYWVIEDPVEVLHLIK